MTVGDFLDTTALPPPLAAWGGTPSQPLYALWRTTGDGGERFDIRTWSPWNERWSDPIAVPAPLQYVLARWVELSFGIVLPS